MNLFDRLFKLEELVKFPPVLVDIGASGFLHPEWKDIAKYCICISFDADEREFKYIEEKKSEFRKLFVFNCIVSDRDKEQIDFFLTNSPYCSSTLKPDNKSLENWSFWELFLTQKNLKLKSRSMSSILRELDITYIDWFKTDSQGTDLKIFKSIDENIISTVQVADFEPGIINAYEGEDKIEDLLRFMEKYSFWISNMTVKGSQRFSRALCTLYKDKLDKLRLTESPGWVEISYLNDFSSGAILSRRNLLVGWIFSTIKKQYGFAMELLVNNKALVGEDLFTDLKKYSEEMLFPMQQKNLKSRVKRRIIKTIENL